MKKILLFCALFVVATTAFAGSPIKKGAGTVAVREDSTFEVTVTVVTSVLGLDVPINLAVVSSGLVGGLLTNLLGIAPPVDVQAGDIITVSALGYETKSFAFNPGVTEYLTGDEGVTITTKSNGTKTSVEVLARLKIR